MAPPIDATRFDLYVRGGGRWQRAESFDGGDKDTALATAAGMDAAGTYEGVRVMAVIEYEGRPPLETLAWISPHLSKVASVSQQMRRQAEAAQQSVGIETAPETADGAALVDQLAQRKEGIAPSAEPVRSTRRRRRPQTPEVRRTNATALVGKMAAAVLVSLAVAAVVFVPLAALSEGLGARFGIGPTAAQGVATALALLVFMVMAAYTMRRVYNSHEPTFETVAPRPTSGLPVRAVSPNPLPQVSAAPEPDDTTEEDGGNDPPTDAPETPRPSGGLDQSMRRHMLQFLAAALTAIKDDVPKMNRHVQFGLNLFMSGAAERYGHHSSLNAMQSFVLVREMVEALGNSPDRVDAYCRQYAEYRAQRSYGAIIAAGQAAMEKHIEAAGHPFDDFAAVMKQWTSNTAARAQAQGIVCIMFTDIVGSTQMTHEHGDYGAQEVVRIHNAVVRSALAAHHGREVKHTGDGIMASFQIPANAVRAAQEIQEQLAAHAGGEGALPVNVRIGLNAGEAVEEEDDFFGHTVQVAARVCDKAGAGEVFVTENVRDLSQGPDLLFEEAGTYDMKGVPEPMMLYRVRDGL